MFDKFSVDFTYKRKLSHILAAHDRLFKESKINVRKNIIVLGGNASGKTTFGKLLCAITNYIIGRELSNQLNLFRAIYNKNLDSYFEIEFALGTIAYRIKSVFNINGFKSESLKKIEIAPSYNIEKLRKKLDETDYSILENYDLKISKKNNEIIPFFSKMLRDPKNSKIYEKLVSEIGFHYIFSNFADQSNVSKITVSVDMINTILPKIDNSVEKVVALKSNDPKIKTSSYIIVFKNGEHITIPDGNLLSSDKDRLSHGTYECLSFLNTLVEINKRKSTMIFIDEYLAHLHAELEAYLVRKTFCLQRNAQIFFTSHNTELLALNIPANSFMLFKRCKNGFNTALYANDIINKNDRNLRNYYENDSFGINPDYSPLDAYFEKVIHD